MTTVNDNFNGIQEYANDQGLKLDWLDQHGEWGVKASADGQKGLTLSDVQVGRYGDPAPTSDNMTGRSRGAASRPNAYRIGGYQVRTKSDIWLGCVDISSQPYESTNEMEEAEVPMRQLVESGEDMSVVFDLADEALHKMTLSV